MIFYLFVVALFTFMTVTATTDLLYKFNEWLKNGKNEQGFYVLLATVLTLIIIIEMR